MNSGLLNCEAVSLDLSRHFKGPQGLHLQELTSARGTPEDGGSTVPRNVEEALTERTRAKFRQTRSSTKPLRTPRTSQFMQCCQHRPQECPCVLFNSVYVISNSNTTYRSTCLRDMFLTCCCACWPPPANIRRRKPDMRADSLQVVTCGVDYCRRILTGTGKCVEKFR